MFDGILENGLTFYGAAVCTAVSVGCGIIIALCNRLCGKSSRNLFVSLIVLPAIVQAVIMMVNGNIGTGVAVMGAFSLIRFRSAPGSSKDISFIFLAMAAGIASGIGQIWFALLFTAVICVIFVAVKFISFDKNGQRNKTLKITLPDTVDFESELVPVLDIYAAKYSIVKFKTTDMGTLVTVTYNILLKKGVSQKQMVDDIRIKNSNLPVSVISSEAEGDEL